MNQHRAAPASGPLTLPGLREDLQLHAGATQADGTPTWTIQDPVNNRFFQIGWLEFELLSRWHLGTDRALLEATGRETLLRPTNEELVQLLDFLQECQLLVRHDAQHTAQLIAAHRRGALSKARWLLHHYLFFRIPLWYPDLWLQRAMPWFNWIYTRGTAWVVLALSALGLLLAARQADQFAASFVETLSPGGFLGYAVALALAKSLHELGHALTATRYGVRVAHMGVAFLVLWPVLYTDTGESWRLRRRSQRLAIASAGVVTELALAALATLAWSLAEPGDLRQSLFFLASTAWLISLAINISPFMRFDGYFILSDALDLPNLHERSFALARTWMRRHLLGWQDPDPEEFSPARRRLLIAFALLTWVYRLTVFVGIAAAVYFMFFKLLGILLFVVEVVWFVLRPFTNEFKVWAKRRQEIRTSRRATGVVVGLGLMVLALLPWDRAVHAQAWLHAQSAHTLYSPRPARIVRIPLATGQVQQGALLVELEHPDVLYKADIAQIGSESLNRQLAGLAAQPDGEDRRATLEQQRAVKLAENRAELAEQTLLKIQAPVTGTLTDLDPELRPGVWVSPHQALATVVAPGAWTIDALVQQQDVTRIRAGGRVHFYPSDAPWTSLAGEVTEADTNPVGQLPHAALSSRFGGAVAVHPDNAGMTPRDALYRVRIRLLGSPDRMAVRRGTVSIDATPRSWLQEAAKSLAVALVRESSF